jgi:hypothetical protein
MPVQVSTEFHKILITSSTNILLSSTELDLIRFIISRNIVFKQMSTNSTISCIIKLSSIQNTDCSQDYSQLINETAISMWKILYMSFSLSVMLQFYFRLLQKCPDHNIVPRKSFWFIIISFDVWLILKRNCLNNMRFIYNGFFFKGCHFILALTCERIPGDDVRLVIFCFSLVN